MTSAEAHRERLQAHLDASKTQRERNILGQFATPGPLAIEIVESARAMMGTPSGGTGPNGRLSFLDPAFGTGAFYSALLQVFPQDAIRAAQGFEIDPHYGAPAADLWEPEGLRLELCDFTTRRPAGNDVLADLLICNPPYVRHHHIEREMKRRLAADVEGLHRLRVSGLAGLYVHFMLISHRWLKPDALSIWLVPSEFMDVNYGAALKNYLLTRVDMLRIHRFDPAEVQFGDAMVSSAVVWFRNRRATGAMSEFTYGGSIAEPSVRQRINRDALASERKWIRFPTGVATRHQANVSRCESSVTLADLFSIKRGIVTGANDFFVLDEARARETGISPRFFRPVLPSPRHLRTDVVEADINGAPDIAKSLYLFDCRLPPDELRDADSKAADYVGRGEAAGVDKGYLASRRDPWYAQERREPAPFLCTYMGRSLEGRAPFRIVLNKSEAIATNVYLMLYPKTALARATSCADGRESVWWSLRRAVETHWNGSGRVYGGGLHKVEPSELGRVPADILIEAHPELRDEVVQQPTLL